MSARLASSAPSLSVFPLLSAQHLRLPELVLMRALCCSCFSHRVWLRPFSSRAKIFLSHSYLPVRKIIRLTEQFGKREDPIEARLDERCCWDDRALQENHHLLHLLYKSSLGNLVYRIVFALPIFRVRSCIVHTPHNSSKPQAGRRQSTMRIRLSVPLASTHHYDSKGNFCIDQNDGHLTNLHRKAETTYNVITMPTLVPSGKPTEEALK